MNNLQDEKIIIVKEVINTNNPSNTNNVAPTQTFDLKKPYSKSLYLFFILLQLALSFDFGFIQCKSRKHKIVVKILTTIPFLVMLIALLNHIRSVTSNDFLYIFWLLSSYLPYGLMVLCTLSFNRQTSFCVLLEKLSSVDTKMGTQIKNCEKIIMVSTALVLSFKIFISYTHCTFLPSDCIHEPLIYVIMFISETVIDYSLVLYVLSFHLTYLRVKQLKDNIIINSYEPISIHTIYKSLVDCIESCKKIFDILYVISLFYKVPVALATSYNIIRDIKFDISKSQDSLALYSNWVFQYLTIVIVPAVIASRLAREVQKIKTILHDKLLLERATGKKAQAIKNFLLYIAARPMRFYICSVIPLNSSFPFVILNFFVTYLIIAVQLSHLY